MLRVFALIALAALAGSARAEPSDAGLSPADRTRLDKQKILVGRRTYRSVTVPYRMPGVPVFITSDSVLVAYHTLLRELTVAHNSGVDLLAAPGDALEAAKIREEHLSRMLAIARTAYDHIIVDTDGETFSFRREAPVVAAS